MAGHFLLLCKFGTVHYSKHIILVQTSKIGSVVVIVVVADLGEYPCIFYRPGEAGDVLKEDCPIIAYLS